MPHKSHTSKPPSWGTLFPGLPASPLSYAPLPQYVESVHVEQPPEKSEAASGQPTKPARSRRRCCQLTTLAICVCCLSFVFVMTMYLFMAPQPTPEVETSRPQEEHTVYNPKDYVKGDPTWKYIDNLRDDVKYVSSWSSAGWTNDVMTYANLIYLGILTERVPIVPFFIPSHLPFEAGNIDFGEIFDVPRLSAAIHIPVLEWHNVKNRSSGQWEALGCWSVWMASGQDDVPRPSRVTDILLLDASYTSIPNSFRLDGGDADFHTSLPKIMTLSFPSGRRQALAENGPRPAEGSKVILEPDEHLMCLDYVYYTGLDRKWEWEEDWSPQWRFVGVHMHWAPRVEALAKAYLNRHWGTDLNGPVPTYISVHLRRGDFKRMCPNEDDSCLASPRQIGRRVREVQDKLLFQRNITTDRVLITSDETDPAWWQKMIDNGWTRIDHIAEKTDETYGKWYSPVLDAAFQSMGTGFIGTSGSTMSVIAARRVEDWNNGVTASLEWRFANEDDL